MSKYEGHEAYMLRRIKEEEDKVIRRLATSDSPEPEINSKSIIEVLERIEKKIDKLIEKGG